MAIVVGIDGSRESEAAFRFALEEARIRAVGVRAVAVWYVPAVAYAGGAYAPSVDLSEGIEAEARRRIEEVVAREESSGVEVETVVRQGQPAQILLEEAKDADLLGGRLARAGRLSRTAARVGESTVRPAQPMPDHDPSEAGGLGAERRGTRSPMLWVDPNPENLEPKRRY